MADSKVSYEIDGWGVKLLYPDRSCNKCGRYPCFEGIQKCKSDFAKYGCKLWIKPR